METLSPSKPVDPRRYFEEIAPQRAKRTEREPVCLARTLRLYCNVSLILPQMRRAIATARPHFLRAHPVNLDAPAAENGMRNLAYTITAKRDNETMTCQRSSVLIALAKAKVWDSEGWEVSITTADDSYQPADFARLEQTDAPQHRLKPQDIDGVAGNGGGEIGDVAVMGEDDDLPRAAGQGQQVQRRRGA